ncbi:MAG: sulfotransferase [Deltaproteobacteria bacterium]|nr:sulfotransferase [Deltaproteobacteria bacterium]MBV8454025.1 sulfotransferase [Deltaproteobacteria bacterium]
MLRGIDRGADILGLFNQPLQVDLLAAEACRRVGAEDFGEWSFREPLAVLLQAYQEEAGLTAFGRVAARWDMLRFLCNLLRLRLEEKNTPKIVHEEVKQPIFLMGLPRSGTTFLHNLLAQDPANLAVRCWQAIYPYPLREQPSGEPDRRQRTVSRQFASFLRLAPELPSVHPLEADAAQECIEITGQVFRSLRFDTTHYVPSYERWLDQAGHHEAYRFHKRFLQHLQYQSGPGRWVLKSPDHIFAMNALLETYPDAQYVFVHRDPLEVLSSVARLTEILRQPFARRVDRMQIGQQVSSRWVQGARLLIKASKTLKALPARVLHLHYRSLVRDPLAAVTAIYSHFGLTLTPEAEGRARHFVAERPNGGYARNAYCLEDYGLNPQAEHRRFYDYITHFRIGSEGLANIDSRGRDVRRPTKAHETSNAGSSERSAFRV